MLQISSFLRFLQMHLRRPLPFPLQCELPLPAPSLSFLTLPFHPSLSKVFLVLPSLPSLLGTPLPWLSSSFGRREGPTPCECEEYRNA